MHVRFVLIGIPHDLFFLYDIINNDMKKKMLLTNVPDLGLTFDRFGRRKKELEFFIFLKINQWQHCFGILQK